MDSSINRGSKPTLADEEDDLGLQHNSNKGNEEILNVVEDAIKGMFERERFRSPNVGTANLLHSEDINQEESDSAVIFGDNCDTSKSSNASKPIGVAQNGKFIDRYGVATPEEIGVCNGIVEISVSDGETFKKDDIDNTESLFDPDAIVSEDVSTEEVFDEIENSGNLEHLPVTSFQDGTKTGCSTPYINSRNGSIEELQILDKSSFLRGKNVDTSQKSVKHSPVSNDFDKSDPIYSQNNTPKSSNSSLDSLKFFYESAASNLDDDDKNESLGEDRMPVLENYRDIEVKPYKEGKLPPKLDAETYPVTEQVIGVVRPFNHEKVSNEDKQQKDCSGVVILNNRIPFNPSTEIITNNRLRSHCLDSVTNSPRSMIKKPESYRTVVLNQDTSKTNAVSVLNGFSDQCAELKKSEYISNEVNICQGISSGNHFRVTYKGIKYVTSGDVKELKKKSDCLPLENKLPLAVQNYNSKVSGNIAYSADTCDINADSCVSRKANPKNCHGRLLQKLHAPINDSNYDEKKITNDKNINFCNNVCYASTEPSLIKEETIKGKGLNCQAAYPSLPILMTPTSEESHISDPDIKGEYLQKPIVEDSGRKRQLARSTATTLRSFQRLPVNELIQSTSTPNRKNLVKEVKHFIHDKCNINKSLISLKESNKSTKPDLKQGKSNLSNTSLIDEFGNKVDSDFILNNSSSKKKVRLEEIKKSLMKDCVNKKYSENTLVKGVNSLDLIPFSLETLSIETKEPESSFKSFDNLLTDLDLDKPQVNSLEEAVISPDLFIKDTPSATEILLPEADILESSITDKEIIITSSDVEIKSENVEEIQVSCLEEEPFSKILKFFDKDLNSNKTGSILQNESENMEQFDFPLTIPKTDNIFKVSSSDITDKNVFDLEIQVSNGDLKENLPSPLIGRTEDTVSKSHGDQCSSETISLNNIQSVVVGGNSKIMSKILSFEPTETKDYDHKSSIYSEFEKIDQILDREFPNTLNKEKSEILTSPSNEPLVSANNIKVTTVESSDEKISKELKIVEKSELPLKDVVEGEASSSSKIQINNLESKGWIDSSSSVGIENNLPIHKEQDINDRNSAVLQNSSGANVSSVNEVVPCSREDENSTKVTHENSCNNKRSVNSSDLNDYGIGRSSEGCEEENNLHKGSYISSKCNHILIKTDHSRKTFITSSSALSQKHINPKISIHREVHKLPSGSTITFSTNDSFSFNKSLKNKKKRRKRKRISKRQKYLNKLQRVKKNSISSSNVFSTLPECKQGSSSSSFRKLGSETPSVALVPNSSAINITSACNERDIAPKSNISTRKKDYCDNLQDNRLIVLRKKQDKPSFSNIKNDGMSHLDNADTQSIKSRLVENKTFKPNVKRNLIVGEVTVTEEIKLFIKKDIPLKEKPSFSSNDKNCADIILPKAIQTQSITEIKDNNSNASIEKFIHPALQESESYLSDTVSDISFTLTHTEPITTKEIIPEKLNENVMQSNIIQATVSDLTVKMGNFLRSNCSLQADEISDLGRSKSTFNSAKENVSNKTVLKSPLCIESQETKEKKAGLEGLKKLTLKSQDIISLELADKKPLDCVEKRDSTTDSVKRYVDGLDNIPILSEEAGVPQLSNSILKENRSLQVANEMKKCVYKTTDSRDAELSCEYSSASKSSSKSDFSGESLSALEDKLPINLGNENKPLTTIGKDGVKTEVENDSISKPLLKNVSDGNKCVIHTNKSIKDEKRSSVEIANVSIESRNDSSVIIINDGLDREARNVVVESLLIAHKVVHNKSIDHVKNYDAPLLQKEPINQLDKSLIKFNPTSSEVLDSMAYNANFDLYTIKDSDRPRNLKSLDPQKYMSEQVNTDNNLTTNLYVLPLKEVSDLNSKISADILNKEDILPLQSAHNDGNALIDSKSEGKFQNDSEVKLEVLEIPMSDVKTDKCSLKVIKTSQEFDKECFHEHISEECGIKTGEDSSLSCVDLTGHQAAENKIYNGTTTITISSDHSSKKTSNLEVVCKPINKTTNKILIVDSGLMNNSVISKKHKNGDLRDLNSDTTCNLFKDEYLTRPSESMEINSPTHNKFVTENMINIVSSDINQEPLQECTNTTICNRKLNDSYIKDINSAKSQESGAVNSQELSSEIIENVQLFSNHCKRVDQKYNCRDLNADQTSLGCALNNVEMKSSVELQSEFTLHCKTEGFIENVIVKQSLKMKSVEDIGPKNSAAESIHDKRLFPELEITDKDKNQIKEKSKCVKVNLITNNCDVMEVSSILPQIGVESSIKSSSRTEEEPNNNYSMISTETPEDVLIKCEGQIETEKESCNTFHDRPKSIGVSQLVVADLLCDNTINPDCFPKLLKECESLSCNKINDREMTVSRTDSECGTVINADLELTKAPSHVTLFEVPSGNEIKLGNADSGANSDQIPKKSNVQQKLGAIKNFEVLIKDGLLVTDDSRNLDKGDHIQDEEISVHSGSNIKRSEFVVSCNKVLNIQKADTITNCIENSNSASSDPLVSVYPSNEEINNFKSFNTANEKTMLFEIKSTSDKEIVISDSKIDRNIFTSKNCEEISRTFDKKDVSEAEVCQRSSKEVLSTNIELQNKDCLSLEQVHVKEMELENVTENCLDKTDIECKDDENSSTARNSEKEITGSKENKSISFTSIYYVSNSNSEFDKTEVSDSPEDFEERNVSLEMKIGGDIVSNDSQEEGRRNIRNELNFSNNDSSVIAEGIINLILTSVMQKAPITSTITLECFENSGNMGKKDNLLEEVPLSSNSALDIVQSRVANNSKERTVSLQSSNHLENCNDHITEERSAESEKNDHLEINVHYETIQQVEILTSLEVPGDSTNSLEKKEVISNFKEINDSSSTKIVDHREDHPEEVSRNSCMFTRQNIGNPDDDVSTDRVIHRQHSSNLNSNVEKISESYEKSKEKKSGMEESCGSSTQNNISITNSKIQINVVQVDLSVTDEAKLLNNNQSSKSDQRSSETFNLNSVPLVRNIDLLLDNEREISVEAAPQLNYDNNLMSCPGSSSDDVSIRKSIDNIPPSPVQSIQNSPSVSSLRSAENMRSDINSSSELVSSSNRESTENNNCDLNNISKVISSNITITNFFESNSVMEQTDSNLTIYNKSGLDKLTIDKKCKNDEASFNPKTPVLDLQKIDKAFDLEQPKPENNVGKICDELILLNKNTVNVTNPSHSGRIPPEKNNTTQSLAIIEPELNNTGIILSKKSDLVRNDSFKETTNDEKDNSTYSLTYEELMAKCMLREVRVILENIDFNKFSKINSNIEHDLKLNKDGRKIMDKNTGVKRSSTSHELEEPPRKIFNHHLSKPISDKPNQKCGIGKNQKKMKRNEIRIRNSRRVGHDSFIEPRTRTASERLRNTYQNSETVVKTQVGVDPSFVFLPRLSSFSDVYKSMLESNIKKVGIPKNVFNCFKKNDRPLTSVYSGLEIICSRSYERKRRFKRRRSKSFYSGADDSEEENLSKSLHTARCRNTRLKKTPRNIAINPPDEHGSLQSSDHEMLNRVVGLHSAQQTTYRSSYSTSHIGHKRPLELEGQSDILPKRLNLVDPDINCSKYSMKKPKAPSHVVKQSLNKILGPKFPCNSYTTSDGERQEGTASTGEASNPSTSNANREFNTGDLRKLVVNVIRNRVNQVRNISEDEEDSDDDFLGFEDNMNCCCTYSNNSFTPASCKDNCFISRLLIKRWNLNRTIIENSKTSHRKTIFRNFRPSNEETSEEQDRSSSKRLELHREASGKPFRDPGVCFVSLAARSGTVPKTVEQENFMSIQDSFSGLSQISVSSKSVEVLERKEPMSRAVSESSSSSDSIKDEIGEETSKSSS